jgi:cob(I)alamin adenosyltransferase
MKIYTKTGDEGETGLYGGGRVRKDHARLEAFGTVDELNAAIGVLRAELLNDDIQSLLESIQNQLFNLGAELATPDPENLPNKIGATQIEALEKSIDRFEDELQPLKNFILPGGTRVAGVLHLARTICRRAERRVITMQELIDETISQQIVIYLNRLSDLLFVLARVVNRRAGNDDVPWNPS